MSRYARRSSDTFYSTHILNMPPPWRPFWHAPAKLVPYIGLALFLVQAWVS